MTSPVVRSLLIALFLLGIPQSALAQGSDITADDEARNDPIVEPSAPRLQLPTPAPEPTRACDGCPERRLGNTFLWVTIVNGGYELANLIRGQDTA